MNFLKWFYPGLKIKRWIVLAAGGAFLIVSGTALLVGSLLPLSRYLLLEWGRHLYGPLSSPPGAAFLFLLGMYLMIMGLIRTFRSVVFTLAPEDGLRLIDVLYTRRYLNRGPRIVVVGGGTGLSVLLRGLKKYTNNITAIVSVADDGGSSGRLRGDLGILPPGDIRNCLVALADKESLMEDLLQYRFSTGELAGHSLGNLLIAAMHDLAGGFHQAIRGMSRVLAVRGQVLPSTLQNICLGAEFSDGAVVFGESNIPRYGRKIKRIFLRPAECYPLPEALQAIAEADAVVLGPGSLYTSILPNLMVNGLADSIAKSGAIKIYVCNIMTQPGETDGYSASAHIRAILAHAGKVIDFAVVNRGDVPKALRDRYSKERSIPVALDIKEIEKMDIRAVPEQLMAVGDVVRHDPDKLARIILKLILKTRNDPRGKVHLIRDLEYNECGRR
ncbi:MAG: gluconeogenesis factor YvcK family protein [Bacillota bacterium]